MMTLEYLYCHATNQEVDIRKLRMFLETGSWVHLLPSKSAQLVKPSFSLPKGPGLVITGGGSSGESHHCLLPCHHLDQSADATADWLKENGLDPSQCIICNPLPIHHVSGLMPWWRSRRWGTKYIWIEPSMMRNPDSLEESLEFLKTCEGKHPMLSLVPTQLKRLVGNETGLRWLKEFSIIWVGGAALSQELVEKARSEMLPLAPCYGATETAAMITALSPREFLAGEADCGKPLRDVQLRLSLDRSLEVKTQRLAIGYLTSSGIECSCGIDGWWRSGDEAHLTICSSHVRLLIIGRRDIAVNSGGQIVFPDELQIRFMEKAYSLDLGIECILFLPVKDQEWGERIVALVRWKEEELNRSLLEKNITLERVFNDWLPAEKPVKWYSCNELEPSQSGKWERRRWLKWMELNL